ncbi:MAG TPA: branched-chain amino acid ABC transporter substrate-binding protein [Dehalococcoidia bacterium]|nr:branched-chain amino acid ABC transporter substrate-binding protein [Dehalococcoidia bacterium]
MSPPRRFRRFPTFVILMAFLLLPAACGGDSDEEALPTASPRGDAEAPIVVPPGAPLVVGISAALTGPEEAGGREDLHAALTGIERWKAANGDEIAGHEIAVQAEDDACTDQEAAVEAAHRLLSVVGLVGVIGPDCSAGAEAAIPVYVDAGVVAVSGTSTQTNLTTMGGSPTYFFRTAYRNDLQGTLIGHFTAIMLQAKNVFLIDDGESYGKDLASAARELMEESDINVVYHSAKPGAEDFSVEAQEASDLNPDVVIFVGFNPQAALFYRQLRDAGYSGLFGASDAAATASFLDPVGAQAEDVLFSGCAVQLPEDVLADFQEIHGGAPNSSAFTAQMVDAATILLDAVAKTAEEQPDGSLVIDPEALRDAVAGTDLTAGASGNLAFNENGDRVPHAGDDLEALVRETEILEQLETYVDLGLIPCQVQDGQLVNLLGPDAGIVRGLPD